MQRSCQILGLIHIGTFKVAIELFSKLWCRYWLLNRVSLIHIQDCLNRYFSASGVAAKSCIKMNLGQLFSGIARILPPFLCQRRIAPALQLIIDVVVRLTMPYQIDIQFFQSRYPL